jgi:5-methyltetrahydropteroyltriglutamate--homocysteine methyltransferase
MMARSAPDRPGTSGHDRNKPWEKTVDLGPLATTTVGSFPRPTWLADVNRSRAEFRLEGAALAEAQDDAVVVILKEQEDAGLDIVTDGEQRRESFVWYLPAGWEGVDVEHQAEKQVYRNRVAPRLVPRITGKVRRRAPLMPPDVEFAKAHTDRPLKMAVPGPMTVIDSTLNEAYDDEAELAMDIAAALNAELLDLQAAGCDVLQLDEPAMTRYHEKVADYGAEALDTALEGITVPTIVHLCFGYPGGTSLQHEYEYPGLLDNLMETRIGGFAVEFGRSTFDPAVLEACGDRIVMYGCIDPGAAPVPGVDAVKARVEEALEHLDPAQVWLAPDCGLMTIDRALARDKIAVMVEAARQLRSAL